MSAPLGEFMSWTGIAWQWVGRLLMTAGVVFGARVLWHMASAQRVVARAAGR